MNRGSEMNLSQIEAELVKLDYKTICLKDCNGMKIVNRVTSVIAF